MKRGCLVVVLILAVAGCSILPEKTTVSIYTLKGVHLETAQAPSIAARVAVARPRASGLLASPRILVYPTPNSIEVFPSAEWDAPVPELLGRQWLSTLEADGRITSVFSSRSGLLYDIEINSDIRAFHLALQPDPHVAVQVTMTLVRYPGGNVVATRHFETTQPVSSQQVADTVIALDGALQQLLPGWTDWVVENIASLQSASPSEAQDKNK